MSLLDFLSQYYYSVGVMVIVEFVALGVALRNYKRHRPLRVFTYYLVFSLIQMSGGVVYFGLGQPLFVKNIYALITNTFMLYEFGLCIFYILRNISARGRKIAIYVDAGLYLALLVYAEIRDYRAFYHYSFFFFESFFLLLPCLLYFYDRFVSAPSRPLTDDPSFWIVTGFLLLNSCSMPMYMALEFMNRLHSTVYTANYILYTLLFLLLIRAYRCPPMQSTANAPAQ